MIPNAFAATSSSTTTASIPTSAPFWWLGCFPQFQAEGEAEPDAPADQHPAERLADMLEFVFDLRSEVEK